MWNSNLRMMRRGCGNSVWNFGKAPWRGANANTRRAGPQRRRPAWRSRAWHFAAISSVAVYAERPTHCRDFECALFIAVAGGELETTAAQRAIGLARQRAQRVRRLLRALGDHDETKALNVRFRKTRRRFENMPIGEDAAATFAQLTLAVHDLNLLLGEKFYPGDADIRCG